MERNAFRVGFFNNKLLLIAVVISILSTLAVVFVPPLTLLFQTVQLEAVDWVVVALLSMVGFLVLPEIFIRKHAKSTKMHKD
jgi:Ca2+-transporting ATPase